MIGATIQDTMTAVGTVATAAIALVAAAFTAREYVHRFGSGSLETYLKLEETTERPSAISARASVARSYLKQTRPNVHALLVALGGFERIAFAARTKLITEQMVWSYAGDRILAYWYAFEEQIRERNSQESSYWEDLIWLKPRLVDINVQKRVRVWNEKERDVTIHAGARPAQARVLGSPNADAGG